MKTDMSYTEAFSKLEQLVEELEDGDIQVDRLAEKVYHANELIEICENKLRETASAIKLATNGTGTNSK